MYTYTKSWTMTRNSLVLEGKVYFVYLRQWWLLRLKSVQSSLFSLLNEGKGRQLKVCRILYYLLLSKCRTEVSTRLTSPFLILDQLQQTQSQSNPLWSFHLGLLVALFFAAPTGVHGSGIHLVGIIWESSRTEKISVISRDCGVNSLLWPEWHK